MPSTRLDLSAHVRKKSIDLLQPALSTALDLEAQLKQAHWNVKGPTFLQLHELFDKAHSVVEGMVDTVAERMTALGGVADGRVQTTAKATALNEYALDARWGEDHLKLVASALAEFAKYLRIAIDKAAEFGDAGTSDVFTQISREVDKQLWFIESHLYKEVDG
jgi:starvation-inducible DNA-binding protein